MKRKQFIKAVGVIGAGSVLPLSKIGSVLNAESIGELPVACTLIPSETRGPFPSDGSYSGNLSLNRTTINEDQTGVALALTVTVQNLNCTPIPNARVDVWHCNKSGQYSGYSVSNNPGQAGKSYCRGYATTNSNGQVTFNTIFPGWYQGRLTHIHVEVYIGGVLKRTSQFAFPLDSVAGSETRLVNVANGQGNNTITAYSGDNVFSDGYTEQLLTLSGSVAAGYTATHTFILDYTVPVELLSFKAGLEDKKTMLWWATASEVNFSHFEIERSTHPSKGFETIGKVAAQGYGGITQYSYQDEKPLNEDVVYYRLKMVDTDDTTHYSKAVAINNSILKSVELSPNPATTELIVKHPKALANTLVRILSIDGHAVATSTLQVDSTASKFDVSELSKGIYFLVFESGIDRTVVKFVKQ
ncbi:MAG: T9SS type A sorting domain-containing protein [Saprospiraceae bacterium]|nr:T9SS type A sorting domain-containing protein [Saprospiraceae bacterium]